MCKLRNGTVLDRDSDDNDDQMLKNYGDAALRLSTNHLETVWWWTGKTRAVVPWEITFQMEEEVAQEGRY